MAINETRHGIGNAPMEGADVPGSEQLKVWERPSWDEYFMQLASMAASRATCLRRKVGAVLVKDKHVLATGYNGAPSGIVDCLTKKKCLRDIMRVPSGERHELCMATHAEQNAIAQAAKHGISVDGATIYITHFPCAICLKILINAGIKRIVFGASYPDTLSEDLLKESGIEYEEYKINIQ